MTIRILILGSLSSSLKNFRGAFIETLLARGHRVDAAAPELLKDSQTRDWLREIGAQPHDVSLARTGLNPYADIKLLGQLRGLIRQLKPDIFLGYTIKPVIWGVLAASFARVPTRVALITGLGYAFTGKGTGRRRWVQRIARHLYAFALSRATLILFQNEDDRDDFKRMGIISGKVPTGVVNGSGVDTAHFAKVALPDTPITFLLIARLLGDKGIREYAKAAMHLRKTHPQARFELVGGLDSNPDGIAQEEVEGWHQAGIINWAGELSDVRPAIAASHVYVLPSYREGTPRTILEAMAAGRPIITSDAPGCRQTVEAGVNGFLVPVGDVNGLQQAMAKFLNDPSLIAPMGEQSRRIAEEKYDVHKVNASILAAIGLDQAGI